MKYLLKVCLFFGLALTFALGSSNIAINQSNQTTVEVRTELFASADDYSKKNRKTKKTKKKNKKKKKKKSQSRAING